MATTTKVLNITFACDDGTTSAFAIPDYDPAVADTVIKTQVNAILAQGALGTGGKAFTSIASVRKVDTTTTDVDMAIA